MAKNVFDDRSFVLYFLSSGYLTELREKGWAVNIGGGKRTWNWGGESVSTGVRPLAIVQRILLSAYVYEGTEVTPSIQIATAVVIMAYTSNYRMCLRRPVTRGHALSWLYESLLRVYRLWVLYTIPTVSNYFTINCCIYAYACSIVIIAVIYLFFETWE